MKTPEFLWGAATSSHQIEGGNKNNDWWNWEAEGRIEGGVRSGAATDHWSRRREDLLLAQSLGLNSYRFSIEWSRVEPEEGKWDDCAISWYRDLISDCEDLGLLPMLTLHHFTLPNWLASRGGFAAADAPEKFLRYVTKVSDAIGSRVPLWCTINESLVLIAGSYLGHFMPPGTYAPKSASLASHGLLKSHVLAYDLLHSRLSSHREGRWASHPLMVGYAHNMISIKPERKYHPFEALIARKLNHLYNYAWIDATTGGDQHLGLVGVFPRAPLVAEARGRLKTDFIGVNYYTKGYVQWWPRAKDPHQVGRVPVGMSFARRRDASSDLEWAVYPKGLGKILQSLRRYGLPIYITENGIADRDDRLRPRYIVSHLSEVAHARESGLDIRGYFHWSLLDNFEWIKGFWPRFGLYSVDYDTFERKETASARLYREIIRVHGAGAPDARVLRDFARVGV